MKSITNSKYVSLIVSIVIAYIPSFIGASFRPGAWYLEIVKPEWNPPSWVFGPVWIILYLTIGIALWMVWETRHKSEIKTPLIIFFVHLFLNAIWSWIFFGLHDLFFAFIEIISLWIMIIITILKFYKIKKIAGLILIPYFLWVSFASFLNYTIWQLNS